MKQATLIALLLLIGLWACRKDSVEPDPPPPSSGCEDSGDCVNLPLEDFPLPLLSDYNFFEGDMADMQGNEGVLPYDLISNLFTDYAKKNRYVWMPEGSSATYTADGQILDFPVGTVLIKTFYYDNVQPSGERRIMETRLLVKMEEQWEFGEYVWNDEQTEAELDLVGSFTPVSFIDDNGITRDVNYRLPSIQGGECLVCHKKNALPVPIGPKPQNLNQLMDYDTGTMHQLDKWQDMGYLDNSVPADEDILTVVDWKDESMDLQMRVRSYIDINCGHCHAGNSHCDYRPMRFAYEETADPVNLGICVEPDEDLGASQSHIVSAGNIARSMLYYRFSATDEAVRMPLLGRSIRHDEAIAMIEEWIESLDPPCD